MSPQKPNQPWTSNPQNNPQQNKHHPPKPEPAPYIRKCIRHNPSHTHSPILLIIQHRSTQPLRRAFFNPTPGFSYAFCGKKVSAPETTYSFGVQAHQNRSSGVSRVHAHMTGRESALWVLWGGCGVEDYVQVTVSFPWISVLVYVIPLPNIIRYTHLVGLTIYHSNNYKEIGRALNPNCRSNDI